MVALPTVQDLKVHLNITSNSNDDELGDMLDAAVELVEAIVGPIQPGPVTEVHTVSSGRLILRQIPAAELTAISARYSRTDSMPLTVADYELDTNTGIVTALDGSRFYGTYVVEYTVGRADLPASIRLAILIIAAHLWETQRGTSPSPLALQQSDLDVSAPVGIGYAVPARARELLAPYVTPTVA